MSFSSRDLPCHSQSVPQTCSIVTVHDFSLRKLAKDDLVELHIAIENGKLVATKLEHDDDVASTMEVKLEGPVTAISDTGTQVTIAGVTVELSTLLNMTKVHLGTELEITGLFSNGVLTATTAEIDS